MYPELEQFVSDEECIYIFKYGYNNVDIYRELKLTDDVPVWFTYNYTIIALL